VETACCHLSKFNWIVKIWYTTLKLESTGILGDFERVSNQEHGVTQSHHRDLQRKAEIIMKLSALLRVPVNNLYNSPYAVEDLTKSK